MARPRVRPIIETNCAYCGKKLVVTLNTVHPNHNRFCSMEHKNLYSVGKTVWRRWRSEALLTEYRRIKELVDRYPTADDIKQHSSIYISVFQKRFGTLDNIAKLAYPEFDPNADDGSWDINTLSPEDGGWISGLCAGEACLRISKSKRNGYVRYDPVFHIHLRADDIQMLMELKRLWKIDSPILLWDREKDRKRGINAGDGAKLIIRDIPILANRVIPTLERYSMRGKKKNDLVLFKRGLQIFMDKRLRGHRYSKYTDRELAELDQIFLAMKEAKKYNGNLDDILRKYPAVMLG